MSSESDSNEMISGKNAVLAFLAQSAQAAENGQGIANKGGDVSKVFISSGLRPDARIEEIKRLAKLKGVTVSAVERRQLDRLAGPGERHQGVVAQVSPVAMLTLEQFLERLPKDEAAFGQAKVSGNPVVAILDGIEDPHNLGAIIRVAECAGLKAILLPARRSASLNNVVARTSAGAVASLPMVRLGNIVKAIEMLKACGFWVIGMAGEAEQNYFALDLKGPLVVVIGSEGEGISRLVSEHCDFLLSIPLLGKTDSLNASVAAGIIFYEIVRQRFILSAP